MRTRLRVEPLEGRDVPAALFVDPAGSDGNPGTAAAPFLTLQHAADVVAPGDVVTARGGTYRGFNLFTSGTAAAPIVFRADAAPALVVVNQPNSWGYDGINLEGASHVIIDGFAVQGIPRAGIRAVEDEFVTFRNNTATDNGEWGIFTGFSPDLLIENNVASRSKNQHGIYVSNSGDRPVIRGNTVVGNYASGIQLNADASAGNDGIIFNAVIENNVIRANGARGGASINLDGVQDSDVRNNIIDAGRASGIALFKIDGATGSMNNRIVNNTVTVDAGGRWAVTISGGSTGNVVRNNIMYSAAGAGALLVTADSMAGLASDYNAVENAFSTDDATVITLAQWRAQTGQDAHSIVIADVAALDAMFVNRAGGDLHLSATSIAIDAGTALGAPMFDFEGTARPSGAGFDIGADERVTTSPPPPVVPPPPVTPPVTPPKDHPPHPVHPPHGGGKPDVKRFR